jgi:hypothetical protein
MELPRSIAELDLTTRQVRTLVKLGPALTIAVINGGVTRANDGSFAVIRDEMDFDHSPIIYHFQADGTLIHEWEMPHVGVGVGVIRPRPAFRQGGALSPDAKSIALAGHTLLGARLEVVILDVQSGKFVIEELLRANEAPLDKTNMHASTLWSPTGELYVISEVGLHKVDRATGEGILVHPVELIEPQAPSMSSDGRFIYFSQRRGNPRGGTIWSMDVASGELTRRSMRSPFGNQSSPVLSPDGEWLLMQEANLIGSVFVPAPIFTPNPLIGATATPKNISAVRLSEPPIDTQNLNTWIVDAAGQFHSAVGRMAWY